MASHFTPAPVDLRPRLVGLVLVGTGLGLLSGCRSPPPPGDAAELLRPDPSRPWRGVVSVLTHASPVSWAVDGQALPFSRAEGPWTTFDTSRFGDGAHELQVTVLDGNGAMVERRIAFEIRNGPSRTPSFSGRLVELGMETGLPLAPQPPGSYTEGAYGAVSDDFDGDGRLDLFAWSPTSSRQYRQESPWRFAAVGPPGPAVRTAAVGDLDNDGRPDVVAAGREIRLLHNVSGVLQVAPGGMPATLPGNAAASGVALGDIDGDGLLDVAISGMECRGAPSLVLRNEGDLQFVDVAPQLGLDVPDGATFAISLDVVEPGGPLEAWTFHEGCTPVIARHFTFGPGDDLPVLLSSAPAGLPVSPMGSSYVDGDRDGKLDFWHAGDFVSPLWRGPGFTEDVAPNVGLDGFLGKDGSAVSAWSMVAFDAEFDGRPDVFVVHSPSSESTGVLANSAFRLAWDDGDGFREVSVQAGLGGERPCRAAHGADLDSDGDTDFVVGCTDGMRLIRNDLAPAGRGRTLRLRGTVSNASGVHALLRQGAGPMRPVRGSGQPYASGVVHECVRASDVTTVLWPSGVVQEVPATGGAVVEVVEPAVVRVSKRRVVPGEEVRVEVDPAAAGEPGATVRIDGVDADWSQVPQPDADGWWRGRLVAPEAGSTRVLRVTVASKTLAVRPRIYVRAPPAP